MGTFKVDLTIVIDADNEDHADELLDEIINGNHDSAPAIVEVGEIEQVDPFFGREDD